MDSLYVMKKLRQQGVMARRLAEAKIRGGLHLPSVVPVTYEQLLSVKQQLEAALGRQALADATGNKLQ